MRIRSSMEFLTLVLALTTSREMLAPPRRNFLDASCPGVGHVTNHRFRQVPTWRWCPVSTYALTRLAELSPEESWPAASTSNAVSATQRQRIGVKLSLDVREQQAGVAAEQPFT